MEHFKRNQSFISSSPLMGEGRGEGEIFIRGERC